VRLAALVCILCTTTPIVADDYDVFFGTWGTPEQCAGDPIKDGGTILATPFEIDRLFLKQGQLWCALKWGPVEKSERGRFTVAQAICGEDAVRSYLLGLRLEDDQLSLRWEIGRSNAALERCARG